MRRPGVPHWLTLIPRGIGAGLLAVYLVVGSLFVGLELGGPPLAIGLPILGGVLAFFFARWYSSSLEEAQDDPLSPRPQTRWKLHDPDLRNTGLWRAEFDLGGLDVAELDDPRCVREHVERLIADWSYRIGHPYYHCRVARVIRLGAPKPASPGASLGQLRSYRVTLELGGGEPGEAARFESGRLGIGAGLAEFQLESPPQPHLHPADWEAQDFKAADIETSSRQAASIAQARNNPVWDPWLDG